MTSKQRLLGQSALQAFRADLNPCAPEGSPEDQATILVATLLRQSLAAPDDLSAAPIREKALELARSSLGEHALSEGCTYDDFPARSSSDVIRLLSQRADRGGRLNLALHLIESANEIESDPLERGRILAEAVRTTRKLGHLDLSLEQSHQLLRHGRELRSPELTVKAHFEQAAVAQTRGNYVDFRAKTRAGLRIAKANRLRRLSANGWSGLGTSNALQGRYGDAVACFWKAYEQSGGAGQIAVATMGNLGNTLLISGRPAEARKVVSLAMQTAPKGSLFSMLGTFAVSSAQLGDAEGVRWAAAQVAHFASVQGNAVEIAEALMECSAALAAIGEKTEADAVKRRSEEMAARYGFHGLTFKEAMQSVRRISEPPAFNQAGSKAAAAIDDLQAPRIPELAAILSA